MFTNFCIPDLARYSLICYSFSEPCNLQLLWTLHFTTFLSVRDQPGSRSRFGLILAFFIDSNLCPVPTKKPVQVGPYWTLHVITYLSRACYNFSVPCILACYNLSVPCILACYNLSVPCMLTFDCIVRRLKLVQLCPNTGSVNC